MPLTVGIPFLNAESTLAAAIRSVFAQTYQDWELLLVDDGSSDRSLEIARAVRDPRVKVICDGLRMRLSARLNQIVSEAKYDFVARMDADDLMSPYRFERQMAFLASSNATLVTSSMAMLSRSLEPIGIRDGGPTINARSILRGHSLAHAPLLAKKEWFSRNRYNEMLTRTQDAELWFRAFIKGELNEGSIVGMRDLLYFCREEAGVVSAKIIESHRALRHLIRTCPPNVLSWSEKEFELGRSHLRSLVIRGLANLGFLSQATSSVRNRRIEDARLLDRVRDEIKQVLATKVPGLD